MRNFPDMGLRYFHTPVLNNSVAMSGQTDDIINCLITNFHVWEDLESL